MGKALGWRKILRYNMLSIQISSDTRHLKDKFANKESRAIIRELGKLKVAS
jgi:hypothetical protein